MARSTMASLENENDYTVNDDSEDIDDDKVINGLETIIENIRSNAYPDRIKKDIYDCIEEYVTGESSVLDEEIIKYIFRGWYMTQHLEYETDVNVCPVCIQTIKK